MLLSSVLTVGLGVPVWMQLAHLALADALWIAYLLVSARALEAEELVPVISRWPPPDCRRADTAVLFRDRLRRLRGSRSHMTSARGSRSQCSR